jgi:hypothetical protein
MFANPSRIVFASWNVRSIAFTAYSFIFHASFPPIEFPHHLLPPVLPVFITGIIIVNQDTFTVTETVIVVYASCTRFVSHSFTLLTNNFFQISS